jgi:hypothetical protein
MPFIVSLYLAKTISWNAPCVAEIICHRIGPTTMILQYCCFLHTCEWVLQPTRRRFSRTLHVWQGMWKLSVASGLQWAGSCLDEGKVELVGQQHTDGARKVALSVNCLGPEGQAGQVTQKPFSGYFMQQASQRRYYFLFANYLGAYQFGQHCDANRVPVCYQLARGKGTESTTISDRVLLTIVFSSACSSVGTANLSSVC